MAEETEVQAPVIEQDPQQPTPYINKVYSALKDNLAGFHKTPQEFTDAMKDSGYAAKAYIALKDNLSGFNKSENDFYSQVGLKPSLPASVDTMGASFNPIQQPTALTPVLPENRADVAQQSIQQPRSAMMPVKLVKPAPVAPQNFTQTNGAIRKDKSWENLGDFVPNTVLGGLQKDAGQALQAVFEDSSPLHKLGAKLEGVGQDKQNEAAQLGLPDTVTGNVVSTATKFAPDLLELALTPELDIAKIGKLSEILGKYGTKAAQIATGKFPTLMAGKGLTSGYAEAKDAGQDDYEATKSALIKSAEEYGKGALFEGAGSVAGKASDLGKKALEDAGWMAGNKIVAGTEKAILNSSAQAAAFSAVPFITNAVQGKTTSLKELKDNAIFGGVLGLFHGGAKEGDHTAADGASAQVLQRAPLIDLQNFANADIDGIKEVHDMPENAVDLKIKSAVGAQKAFESDNSEEKQQAILQSSIDGKAAGVKSVTDAVLKDKDAVIAAIPDDLPSKPELVAKINEVHKELDPTEQAKSKIGSQISDIDQQIQSASEKSDNPVLQAENEVKLEILTKQREDLNKSLKDIIVKQNTPEPPTEPALPEENTISINEVKDKPITYKGQPAEITQDGQTLIAKIKGTDREYELGNADEIGDKSIKDFGIEHQESVVGEHENGNTLVRGKEYVNNYSDPKSAINYDKDGNVVSVNLETPEGAKRTFKGDVAEDIAYQIHLKEINKDNETKHQFEQFVDQHEPSKSAIVAGENEITAEKAPIGDNAGVSPEQDSIDPKVKTNENTGEPAKPKRTQQAKGGVESGEAKPETKEVEKTEKTTPIKNTDNEKRADELGVGIDKKHEVRGADKVEADATAAIKDGYDTPDLVHRILNEKHQASDTEAAILGKYLDAKETEVKDLNKRTAEDGATMSKREFNEVLETRNTALGEFQDAAQAAKNTGTATAQALNSRKFAFNKEYSLENMVVSKREATGGEKLSPEQLESVMKTHAELEATQKALEERLKKVEDENAKLQAEKSIKKATTDRATRKSITKEQLAEERKQIAAEYSEKLKKMRSEALNDAFKASLEFLQATAPYVAKMVSNLAKEGVVELKDYVSRIKEYLGLDDVADGDINDLIAGKYNKKLPPKDEIQNQIRSLKLQAKLTSEIENLEKGLKSADVKKTKNIDEKVKVLRERINELNKNNGVKDERDLALQKKNLQKKIDAAEDDLANKRFSKPEPPQKTKSDQEALDLRRKYDRIKNEFQVELAKDQLKQRSKIEKLKDDLLNIASLPRALKASLDFSAVLRQGLIASAGHPKIALTALKEMFGQTFSEERYRNWISDLKHTDMYDLMKESDLYLSDKNDPKLIAREEEFTSNLADKIPLGIGKAIAASERAYTGYLNVLRAGVFTSEAQKLIERGYTIENNPERFKALAKVVNVLTGRGDVPEFLGGKQPKVLSAALFSPRFMAARIQTLYLWADPRLPKEAKILAAKDIGATLASGAAILSLASLAGFSVNTDPRSTNFLKIEDKQENGSTYYDILGGLPQYVRFLAQQITGASISSNGNLTDMTAPRGADNPFGKTRLDLDATFLRGKLSPVPGGVLNLQQGKDVVGQPYHLWPNVPMEFVPLPYSDVQEAYQVGGISGALKALLPSQFGVGVSSYDPNAAKK